MMYGFNNYKYESRKLEFDNEDHELAVFEDMFYRDIESGWNVDRFYCDHCYDKFIAEWPLAYSARGAEFQCAGIGLDTFFSGSRLQTHFSPADFRRLIVQLDCPTCDSPLEGNIWPYHLPFDIPKGFISDVEEIGKLAAKTPFLLLQYPLCARIFNLIQRVSASTSMTQIAERLYRARRVGPGVEKSIASFDFAPARYVAEGRYNHAGRPVLYLASAVKICVAEIRGADCLIMGFQLAPPIKILDLVDIEFDDDEERELLNALCYSALASAPENGEGWEKPAYVFTRFLGDCAAYAGFDAIKYSSTRVSEQDGDFNLVILNRSLSLAVNALEPNYARYSSETTN
jgi:hypothetical protein